MVEILSDQVAPPSTSVKEKKEIEKLDAEIKKLIVDTTNASFAIRMEGWKTVASVLTPAMVALTVLGTVYVGYLQAQSKSSSDEDTNWRQVIDVMSRSVPDKNHASHTATLLKPFLESPRYRTVAVGVMLEQLPLIRDGGTFKESLDSVFPENGTDDLTPVVAIAQRLKECAGDLPESSAERAAIIDEEGALCQPLVKLMRNNAQRKFKTVTGQGKATTKSNVLELRRIYFEECDFSNVDFTSIDLTDSEFDHVKLDGAILGNIRDVSPFLWSGTAWWKASQIDPGLLEVLIQKFKPYQFGAEEGYMRTYRRDAVLTKQNWEENIRRLCASAGIRCPDADISARFP